MKKGITLIEVLVATLILTIGMTGMLMSFVTCKRIIIENTHRYNSTLIMNGHFEEIQRRENPADVTNYIITWNKSTVKKEISPGVFHDYTITFRPMAPVTPTTGTDLVPIAATVFWESFSGLKSNTMFIFTNEPG